MTFSPSFAAQSRVTYPVYQWRNGTTTHHAVSRSGAPSYRVEGNKLYISGLQLIKQDGTLAGKGDLIVPNVQVNPGTKLDLTAYGLTHCTKLEAEIILSKPEGSNKSKKAGKRKGNSGAARVKLNQVV